MVGGCGRHAKRYEDPVVCVNELLRRRRVSWIFPGTSPHDASGRSRTAPGREREREVLLSCRLRSPTYTLRTFVPSRDAMTARETWKRGIRRRQSSASDCEIDDDDDTVVHRKTIMNEIDAGVVK